MNKVILVGRLTKDPELKATASGISVVSFTVACERKFVKEGEERKADFVNCIAWRQLAEAIARFFAKGHRIALEGTLQTRSWTDNNGNTRYATEVVVEQWEFAQSKQEAQGCTSGTPHGAFPTTNTAASSSDASSATNYQNSSFTPFGSTSDDFAVCPLGIPIDDEDLPF